MTKHGPRSRLDAFLVNAPFSIGKFSRAADVPMNYLGELRAGKVKPRQDTIARFVQAASRLLGRDVLVTEMFAFGGNETGSPREQRRR